MNNLSRLEFLSRMATQSDTGKKAFRSLAMSILRQVAKNTEFGVVDIRYNAGGIAVSGEATMHADSMYIQISANPFGILVRTCKSRSDYTGGPNQWYPWANFATQGADGLAEYARQVFIAHRDLASVQS